MTKRTLFRPALYGSLLCSLNSFAASPRGGAIDVPVASSPGVLVGTVKAPADAERTTTDLLSRVRLANEELYSSLQSFVCDEQMERFKGNLSGENARHIDTLETKVSFENGTEHYSGVLQNKRQRPSIAGISGAWSEGEFGTLLKQTQILLNTQPVVFQKYTDLNGAAAALYAVEISEQNSPWDLEVERRHYRIPFRTDVWVSRTTGEILKIERVSTGVTSQIGISEMRWGVTLEEAKLDGKTWLLPKTGTYAVLYESSRRREWNEMTFSGYHRYGSEVAVRFQ